VEPRFHCAIAGAVERGGREGAKRGSGLILLRGLSEAPYIKVI